MAFFIVGGCWFIACSMVLRCVWYFCRSMVALITSCLWVVGCSLSCILFCLCSSILMAVLLSVGDSLFQSCSSLLRWVVSCSMYSLYMSCWACSLLRVL